MKIYRITKSYTYLGDGKYGGPEIWLHLFKRAAIRLAARLAQDFRGELSQPRPDLEIDPPLVAFFGNPKNDLWVGVDVIPLRIFQPFAAIKRAFRRRFSWQNLNEKGRAEVTGSILRHGRAWFKPKRYGEGNTWGLHWTWSLWTHFFGADVRICDGDSDGDITLFLGCGLFAFWLTFENIVGADLRNRFQYGSARLAKVVSTVDSVKHGQWRAGNTTAFQDGATVARVLEALAVAGNVSISDWEWEIHQCVQKGFLTRHRPNPSRPLFSPTGGALVTPEPASPYNDRLDTSYDAVCAYWPRKTGIAAHHEALWLSCWERDDWNSTDPKWMRVTFYPLDWLFGPRVHGERVLDQDVRLLTMPEGQYSCSVELKEETWKRKRWPWPARLVRAHIDIPGGVPIPGKGENSYDCGEDATFGLTTMANSFEGGMSALHASVMETRERYGGKNWLPEKAKVG